MKDGKLRLLMLGILIGASSYGCENRQPIEPPQEDPVENMEEEVLENEESSSNQPRENSRGSMIANDEEIIEMLKASGELKDNATAAEIERALQDYLGGKAQKIKSEPDCPKG
ncbi:hypothetical protein SAMN05216353_11155 [Halobacillus alkaliphilus]|uniref:Uncharacterized protein n=1 Tax=Halobacillus alkaliphilus TaxID=396056 RepID=A0A1I2M603_9BACI|nr:hypothetical protein [Halobacillus alkaliphilus]SFF86300.1 hypothetical protein SAMN05216353_11155 [Halobacillus alkaliphilus]